MKQHINFGTAAILFAYLFAWLLAVLQIASPQAAHAAGSSGQTIPFSAVTIEPDHSMRSTGYQFLINLQAPVADSDMALDGACTVNGVDVSSTLDNRTDGLYYLTYIVGANDAYAPEGDIPIQCTLMSPSTGDVVVATHFTDPNTAGVQPDFVSGVQAASDGPTAETITFDTAMPTYAYIEYTLNGVMQSTPVDPDLVTSHSITITGLIPNTGYLYEVVTTTAGGTEGTSPERIPFTTASTSTTINPPLTTGGDPTGGATLIDSLSLSSIVPVSSEAIADGTFEDGWNWTFNINLPSDQRNLALKFSNWTDPSGDTIPTGGNMRISSPEATSTTPIVLSATNAYSQPLILTDDSSSTSGSRLVQVTVEMSIPSGVANGSYSAAYGIESN